MSDDSAPPPQSRQNRYAESMTLFDRARKVIPGGIYGHVSPALTIPVGSPYFAERAEGCRYWDVDGNEFLDFMCGYGPVVLGHGHSEVEEAALKSRQKAGCLNHPSRLSVELAERLVGLVDIADWAVFAKNGSDVTTWCAQVAREFTGRKKLLMAEGAYHGTHPWCTPGHGGLIDEDRAHVHYFRWNDSQSIDDAFKRYGKDLAAVFVTPFHHPMFEGSVMPAEGFLTYLEGRCRQHGSLLIVDDVRAGFRLDLGGSHRFFGFQPDLACYSKALANGHPISAAVGREGLRVAASRVFLTGSFWNSPAEMAAAIKTLEIIERDAVIERLRDLGERFCAGLQASASRAGLEVEISGPPAIPFMRFRNDRDYSKRRRFAECCLDGGVFLHPHHNWFLCAAHTEDTIDEALAIAEGAFQTLADTERP